MRDYWKRVGNRTLSETKALLGLDSREKAVIKIITGVVIILALVFFGSEDASTDEMVVRAAAVAVVVFIFPFVYLWKFVGSPPRMESEAAVVANAKIEGLKERIEALENERRQTLEFDFRPEDNKNLEIVNVREDEHDREYRTGRVPVKNVSNAQSALNLQTTLIHYWKDGAPVYKTVDILLSSYSSGKTVEDIPPRRSVTYDLFRIENSENISHISLGPSPDGSFRQIPIGRYRLKITASPADMPPLTGAFLLDVKDNGEVTYRPWREGDSTHVMSA